MSVWILYYKINKKRKKVVVVIKELPYHVVTAAAILGCRDHLRRYRHCC